MFKLNDTLFFLTRNDLYGDSNVKYFRRIRNYEFEHFRTESSADDPKRLSWITYPCSNIRPFTIHF